MDKPIYTIIGLPIFVRGDELSRFMGITTLPGESFDLADAAAMVSTKLGRSFSIPKLLEQALEGRLKLTVRCDKPVVIKAGKELSKAEASEMLDLPPGKRSRYLGDGRSVLLDETERGYLGEMDLLMLGSVKVAVQDIRAELVGDTTPRVFHVDPPYFEGPDGQIFEFQKHWAAATQAASSAPETASALLETAATRRPESNNKGLTKKAILAAPWPLPEGKRLDDLLSDVPKWLDPAKVDDGAPGKGSHTWNPAMIGYCMMTPSPRRRWTSKQQDITNFLGKYFDEWLSEFDLLCEYGNP